MKYLLVLACLLMLSGCGYVNRLKSHYVGDGSEVCQSGVVYLQFASGVSVKYNQNGTVANCQE